jgi:parallel beta-helix repeat protein
MAQDAETLYQQARTAWDSGDLTAAKQAYRRALSLAPRFSLAHYDLAHLLEEEGDRRGAIHHFQRFLSLAAPFPELQSEMSQAHKRLEALQRGPETIEGEIVVSMMGQGQFTTIQEALRRAASGAQIVLLPGVYRESVVLDKPLEIVGDGPREEIVLTSDDGPCLYMKADYAVVSGVMCRSLSTENVGVYIKQGQLMLEDCTVTSQSRFACIMVEDAGAQPIIRRCRIQSSPSVGLLFARQAGGLVEQCDIDNHSRSCIVIQEGASPTIRQCRINDSGGYGVCVWHNGRGTLDDNDICRSTRAGVSIKSGGAPVLRNNSIGEGQASGVVVAADSFGTLVNNRIQGNALAGVEIRAGGNPTLRDNQIRDNSYGVYVRGGGLGTLDENTLFLNAKANLRVSPRASTTLHRSLIADGPKIVEPTSQSRDRRPAWRAPDLSGLWRVLWVCARWLGVGLLVFVAMVLIYSRTQTARGSPATIAAILAALSLIATLPALEQGLKGPVYSRTTIRVWAFVWCFILGAAAVVVPLFLSAGR